MPNNSINNALIRQFSDRFHVTAEQTMSLLAHSVDVRAMTGDDFAYDRFGSLESSETIGRLQPVNLTDVDISRRQLTRQRHTLPVAFDSNDLDATLTDPKGQAAIGMVAAFNRTKDRTIVNACFADVKTGRNFTNTTTFLEDGGSVTDATGGLTYEKLLEIKRKFKSKNVDIKDITLAISDEEEERLMQENKLTSRDFVTEYPIEGRMMRRVLDMRLVIFASDDKNPILNVENGVRDCIAIAQTPTHSGMLLGVSKEINIKIQERPDLIDTTQIIGGYTIGAMRTEGALVQKIQTTPLI